MRQAWPGVPLWLGGCGEDQQWALLPDAGGRNSAPLANAGPVQTGKLGEPVTLDGTGSTDPDGDTLIFSWLLTPPAASQASLSNPKSSKPTFTPDLAGVYVATLAVQDAEHTSQPDRTMVVVPLVGPPTVSVEVGSPPPYVVGTVVGLRATASQPSGAQPLAFSPLP